MINLIFERENKNCIKPEAKSENSQQLEYFIIYWWVILKMRIFNSLLYGIFYKWKTKGFKKLYSILYFCKLYCCHVVKCEWNSVQFHKLQASKILLINVIFFSSIISLVYILLTLADIYDISN